MKMNNIDLKIGDKIKFKDLFTNQILEVMMLTNLDANRLKNRKEIGQIEILRVERPIYTEIKEIKLRLLDKEEREYLNNIIKPFKNKVSFISKARNMMGKTEYIYIKVEGSPDINLPSFKAGTMYKNMQPFEKYILKELGLEK